MKTFREIYCERHGIAVDKFERVLMRRCLHWQAKVIFWLLALDRQYYSPDYEFIHSVGDLRSRQGFSNEVAEYYYHPRNRGFLRRVLRMRVSSRRLQSLFEQEIASSRTRPPFPTGTA